MHFHFHHHHHGGRGVGGPILPSLPPASEANADLVFLKPETLSFRRQGTRVQMLREGGEGKAKESAKLAEGEEGKAGETPVEGEDGWGDVTLVRLFPLTEPNTWISILDKEGREVGVLLDLAGLSTEHHALVQEELRRRYLVPEVSRILSRKPRFDLMEWVVETDRGQTTFLTRNLREQQQPPGSDRIIITDIEGNRYDVPSLEELDPVSRRRLESQL